MRKRTWFATASVAVALALAIASPVAAAGALDQHQDATGETVLIPGGQPIGGAQTFTAAATGNLDQIALYIGIGPGGQPNVVAPTLLRGVPQAPGDNITVVILPTTGGVPDTGPSLGSATAQAPALTMGWLTIPIDPPVAVVSGHVYAILAFATPSGSALGWGGSDDGNSYPAGAAFQITSGGVGPLDGGLIDTSIQDLAFRTYVTRGATPPPTGTAEPTMPAPASHLPLIFAVFALGAAFVTVRKAAEARR